MAVLPPIRPFALADNSWTRYPQYVPHVINNPKIVNAPTSTAMPIAILSGVANLLDELCAGSADEAVVDEAVVDEALEDEALEDEALEDEAAEDEAVPDEVMGDKAIADRDIEGEVIADEAMLVVVDGRCTCRTWFNFCWLRPSVPSGDMQPFVFPSL